MNRKLLVSLLQKNIEELSMITEGFMEMNEYPPGMIHLAKRKTEDIQSIIDQLTEIKTAPYTAEDKTLPFEQNKNAEPEFTVSAPPVQDKHEIKIEIVEQEIKPQLIEPTKITKPEFVVVITPAQDKPEIETVELEELVQEENNKNKKTVPFEVRTEIIEAIPVVQTKIEPTLKTETKEVREIHEINMNHEIKPLTDDTKKTTIAEKMGPATVSRNEKLSKTDNSFSASLANKKIDDIKQAISIGDRFRFQRELFNGNGEEMNKTLNYINQLATLDEVMTFLYTKYGWDAKNENVEDLHLIIKRKFN